MSDDLVGVAEIVEMLGVSRQRVHVIANEDASFRGRARLVVGNIWNRADIERWIRQVGRAECDRKTRPSGAVP